MNNEQAQARLGAVIRKERERLDLSQEALADQVGLHRTYIGSVERGERNISLANIIKIANALKLSAADLVKKAGL
ncbi:Helix-turn-helix transcriptional regulator [Sulfidibacter corallicola]|uniref:Helix-turn-helix transcriptional regulator n=1 Tax=Sulfidibacter corallicola TaxID=2818388 RepID=A0A8A4THJ9_SULCO|nr:helix-turn-helix transcriptional regulator [Sulfidibacter corallicola]QTD48291.1 helix-turn-helix transcriptional regulator [Sulfidibacter corallicola]